MFVRILILTCLLVASPAVHGWAASAKNKYYAAERCYQQLRKDHSQQKYRHRWLKCINKFLAVHHHDPRGPWASAGLYQAGNLYAQLYKRSFYAPDQQEALDIFDRVILGYPKSQYRLKAEKAKRGLAPRHRAPPPPKHVTTTRQWYEKGQAHYQRLQKERRLRKYRDQWLKCIQYYRQAYQAEPEGPLAAAALYGVARCYDELHDISLKKLDRIQSEKSYQELVRKFPESPYAQKSRAALGIGVNGHEETGQDGIAQVIQKSHAPQGPERGTPPMGATADRPASVDGLRFWSNPRYTRVVIDADRDTAFTYHELREDPSIGKPQRIYIDVLNSRLGKNLQKVVPINDNLLSDARAGQYTHDTVRVVVDIKSFKTYKIFSLKNPYRIVLDVWGLEGPRKGHPAKPGQIAVGKGKLQSGAIAKQLALGVRRIVIDPGHGGKDYGAPGYIKGMHEKHVVLEVSKRLKKMIQEQLKCEVLLTRSKDDYLSLEERTAFANTQDADLFISIHTNASRDRRAYGIETYILNLATDDEAIRVAARENATSTRNISDLDTILTSLMNNVKVSESSRFASYVQQSIAKYLRPKYKHVRSKGIKQAPFYVLLGASMPSILIETSFISNPRESKRLNSAAYQKSLCQGIVNGIKRYMKDTNPTAFRPTSGGKG